MKRAEILCSVRKGHATEDVFFLEMCNLEKMLKNKYSLFFGDEKTPFICLELLNKEKILLLSEKVVCLK